MQLNWHRSVHGNINILNVSFKFHRKQRFYLYSRRMPSDLQNVDRDVFNEKPSKEDIIAVPEGQGIHTYIYIFHHEIVIYFMLFPMCRLSKIVQFSNDTHNTW